MKDNLTRWDVSGAKQILNDYIKPSENIDMGNIYYAATQLEAAYDDLKNKYEAHAELVKVSLIEIVNRMSTRLKELCDCNYGEQCTQCFLVDESNDALANYRKAMNENAK